MTATLVGVDGCKAGWIAVVGREGGEPQAIVVKRFDQIVAEAGEAAVVAVDMPIGLPARAGAGGRGPEALVRRLLGARQSSVFTIPSRSAVHAEPGPFADEEERYAAHRRACAIALATSDPPRKVSIQAFGLFPRMRELDLLLREKPELRGRVFESHPELAFRQLNDGEPMRLPKKIKGRINQPGMMERRAVLARHGLDAGFVGRPPPRGAGADDFLDACAMLLVAGRIARGEAECFPPSPVTDEHGLPIAIRA